MEHHHFEWVNQCKSTISMAIYVQTLRSVSVDVDHLHG